jgi:hypothetical protein
VICIYPQALFDGKKRHVNKVASHGHLAESISTRCPKVRGEVGGKEAYQSHVLKTEEALVTKIIRCLGFTHYYHVFDTDPIFSVGVVARFYALFSKI